MDGLKTFKGNMEPETQESFNMPSCEFCYAKCGDCIYYEKMGWKGFCNNHRREISSSDSACGDFR